MKINIENIVKKLDYLCFIIAIVGAIIFIIFEFSGDYDYFKISIISYFVTMVLFFLLAVLRLTASFTDKENINLQLSKFGKVHYCFLIVFTLFCSFWFAFIAIKL